VATQKKGGGESSDDTEDECARHQDDEDDHHAQIGATLQTLPNPYKERTTPVRDDTPIPPETFNATHNMEGEFGVRMDPEVVRMRAEREKEAEENKTKESERAPVPDATKSESA
jgi:hypothetical protein